MERISNIQQNFLILHMSLFFVTRDLSQKPHAIGMKVPLWQSKPRSGFSSASAFMQMTVGGSMLCGITWILLNSKSLHDVSELHSRMMASVWARLGRPTLYQHGCKRKIHSC